MTSIPNPNLRFYVKSYCVVCGDLFYKRKKKRRGRTGMNGVRAANCVTCSKNCSLDNVFKRYNKRFKSKANNHNKVFKSTTSTQ